MINWVGNKTVNMNIVNNKIQECIENTNFTNNGKNVLQLQKDLKNLFHIDENKETLLTCNGDIGINAIIGGFNIHYQKKLRFVQSFTFPTSIQGNLNDSIVFDIDENMGPDIKLLESRKHEYDGIVITNCFGLSVNIELYEKFCYDNNKILVFDNAASSMTFYKNKNHINYGHASMISLHHTKPIGFGEGGFILFDKKYLESMKKSICFGYTDIFKYNYDIYDNNYKISEIASIYISEYLKNIDIIFKHYTKIIKYFIEKIKKIHNIFLLQNYSEYEESLLSTIPIIFDKKVNIDKFIENKIEAKKYYYPIENENHKNSQKLFDNIICLPLNLDIDEKIIDKYIEILNEY